MGTSGLRAHRQIGHASWQVRAWDMGTSGLCARPRPGGRGREGGRGGAVYRPPCRRCARRRGRSGPALDRRGRGRRDGRRGHAGRAPARPTRCDRLLGTDKSRRARDASVKGTGGPKRRGRAAAHCTGAAPPRSLGRRKGALQAVNRAGISDSASDDRHLLAATLCGNGRNGKAHQAVNRATLPNPGRPGHRGARAEILRRLGQRKGRSGPSTR